MKKIINILVFLMLVYSYCFGQNDIYQDTTIINDSTIIVNFYTANDSSFFSKKTEYLNKSEISLTSSLDNIIANNSDGDEFIENISIPENYGSRPYDGVYNPNDDSYYLYCGTKVLCLNANTYEVTYAYDISNYGIFDVNGSNLPDIPNLNKIALNETENKIYCVNENNELISINCNNQTTSDPISTIYTEHNTLSSVYYNEYTDRIYWVMNSSTYHKMLVYNGNTDLIETKSFVSDILDLIYYNDKLFLSLSSSTVYWFDALDLSHVDTYIHQGTVSKGELMVYNPNQYRLYIYFDQFNTFDVIDVLYAANNSFNLIEQIDDIQFIDVTDGDYDDYNNIVFFGVTVYQSGDKVILIDQLHNIIGTYNAPKIKRLEYNQINNITYASGTYLYSFTGNNQINTVSVDAITDELVINTSNNDIGIISIDGGSMRSFDHSLAFESNTNLGSRVNIGSIAESLNKSIWLNWLSNSSFSTATIYDHSTENYYNFNIGAGLNSTAYNDLNKKFFVGFNHDYLGKGVTVLDAVNNTLITTLEDIYPKSIYSSDGDYVYIGSDHKIHIINANNLNINTLEPSGYFSVNQFVEDNENVYALAYYPSLPSGNKVIAIRKSDNTIIAEVPVDQWAYDICIDTDRGKIYVISYQSNNINIINTNDFSTTDWLFAGQFYPNEIEFCSRDNLLFCRGKDVTYNEPLILVLDCSDNSQKGVLNYSGMNMKYNESNNCVYVQGHVSNNNTNELYCRVIHCSTLEIIDDIYLNQNAKGSLFTFYEAGDILFCPTNNQMFIPNCGLSNFSVIQCSDDLLPLQEDRDGWTWLSFPRLNRDGDQGVPVDDVLGDDAGGNSLILPGDYFDGDFKTRPQNSQYMDYAVFNYDNDVWVPDQNDPLNEVKSTYGYKIYLNSDQEYIRLQGSMLDHNHLDAYIELHEDFEDNWTGYWLPETQNPFDAIPQEILDELVGFKSQTWSCAKFWGDGIPHPYWLCATQKDDIELSYGDMVVMVSNSDLNFKWNRFGSSDNDDGRAAPEYYGYTEQSDYTSLFVELDTTDNPLEIGAFVGDSCVGATKVMAEDTIVLIPAYTEGLSGDITLQEYYGTKAASPKREEYYVSRQPVGNWEKRRIHTRENKDFYLVSLTGTKNNVHFQEESSFGLSCYPNPVSNDCRISYTLRAENHVRLEVCDIFGNTLAVIIDGINHAGEHELVWNAVYSSGQKLPAGVYIIQLKINGRTEKTKIVIGG